MMSYSMVDRVQHFGGTCGLRVHSGNGDCTILQSHEALPIYQPMWCTHK